MMDFDEEEMFDETPLIEAGIMEEKFSVNVSTSPKKKVQFDDEEEDENMTSSQKKPKRRATTNYGDPDPISGYSPAA